MRPLDPKARRKILNEALGFWGDSSVEKMLMFGEAYGRGGPKGLLTALALLCDNENYAGAIFDFFTDGERDLPK